MEVAFDAAKNVANIRKHGVSLQRAEDFDFSSAAIAVDAREDYGEVRYHAVGFLDGTLYALIFTTRDNQVRVISLRKATKQERNAYAEEF